MTQNTEQNIILIGMPGSGKSTVGVLLAKNIAYNFVDTDVLIQVEAQRPLQDIVDSEGYLALRKIEEEVLLVLNLNKHIISTGGSAVYSAAAMAHLKHNGLCVFLDVNLETLNLRIDNFTSRGIAKRPEQSFSEVFDERFKLYSNYADITIKCDALNAEQVCEEIMERLKSF